MSKIHLISRLNVAQLVYDVRNKTYQLAQNRKSGQNDEQVAHINAGDDEGALDQILRSIESYARAVNTQFSPFLSVTHNGAGTSGEPYTSDDILGKYVVKDADENSWYCVCESSHTSGPMIFDCDGLTYSVTLPSETELEAGDILSFNGTTVYNRGNASSSLKTALGTAAVSTGTATEDFDKSNYIEIDLAMPSNFDGSMDGVVTEAVHDYLVFMSCYDWYILAKPDEAASFTARAAQAVDIIRQALNKRVAPTLS